MARAADTDFEIFLATAPGLEPALFEEVRRKGFRRPRVEAGGVAVRGGWPDVWRANLWLRGANRVLARFARLRVERLDDLQKAAARLPWSAVLRPDVAIHVEATTARARLYHSGAVAERVANAIQSVLPGVQVRDDASVTVMVRVEGDTCTISLDTSGELLHRRGSKVEVVRAPMRETMAALLLMQCGYDGRVPVVDPMCGSGTFVIEAAEMAAGFNPGRARAFAFEHLATFEADAWQRLRAVGRAPHTGLAFHGSDRDDKAVTAAQANAERAGVAGITDFRVCPVSEVVPPTGAKGLVMVNPPYGARIGDPARLARLYRTFGETMMRRFHGWRVGLVTANKDLAYATALPFLPPGPPIAHGGLRITLYQTAPLA